LISHPVAVRVADTTAPHEQITCAMLRSRLHVLLIDHVRCCSCRRDDEAHWQALIAVTLGVDFPTIWAGILNAIERLQAKAPAEGERVHSARPGYSSAAA
jgi:hypothetical protein